MVATLTTSQFIDLLHPRYREVWVGGEYRRLYRLMADGPKKDRMKAFGVPPGSLAVLGTRFKAGWAVVEWTPPLSVAHREYRDWCPFRGYLTRRWVLGLFGPIRFDPWHQIWVSKRDFDAAGGAHEVENLLGHDRYAVRQHWARPRAVEIRVREDAALLALKMQFAEYDPDYSE